MSIDISRFNTEDVQEIETWVLLTQAMLGADPEVGPNTMKLAIDNLAERCNERWPLARGGSIAFTTDDLGVSMPVAWTEEVAVGWTGKTALCLYSGMDGPIVTASVLKDGIDRLMEEVEAR